MNILRLTMMRATVEEGRMEVHVQLAHGELEQCPDIGALLKEKVLSMTKNLDAQEKERKKANALPDEAWEDK